MKTKQTILTGLFTALIAVGAFVKIPMLPVPMTLQSVFTTLAGILLGASTGATSVLIYIALGLIGLPIFTAGGGLSYVLHPTFGFLCGFVLSTFCIGCICEKKKDLSAVQLAFYSYVSYIPMYIFGALYYYALMNLYIGKTVGVWDTIYVCFILFIPGDIIKCIFCGFCGKRLKTVVKCGIISR